MCESSVIAALPWAGTPSDRGSQRRSLSRTIRLRAGERPWLTGKYFGFTGRQRLVLDALRAVFARQQSSYQWRGSFESKRKWCNC